MRTILLAGCLIGLATPVTPAFAQAPNTTPSQSIEHVRDAARMHMGPLYVTPTVLLRELGVDSNVFNEASNPKSDFTFTVAPKANIWVPIARRALFTTTVAADAVWYATYASERSIDPQFTARGDVYLHRITLFAENAYLNTRQRPNFELDLRSRHLENDVVAGADVRITPKFSVEAAAVRGITRYDADAVFDGTSLHETLNRDTTGFRVVPRHRLTPLTTLALRYENLQDRFPHAHVRDSDSVRVMPGIEFKANALIKGSAFVGYRRFTPEHPAALPQFSGLVSQLGLSYTLLGSTTFGVSYRRDLTYSYEETQPFFVNDNVGVSIRRALGSRFDLLLSTDRAKYSYEELLVPAAAGALVPQRVDTIWSYAGSLGYRVGRDARIGAGLSYVDRTSTDRRVTDYNGLRVGTVVSYGF
jgi:hypothetical protein